MATATALATGAAFSPCRRYRYLLWRRWDTSLGVCAFIGLNPSTADETDDDPTVRRCVRFARDWGYGGLYMLNAYAFRATDPKVMKGQGAAAIGPQNDSYLRHAALVTERVVAAWGAHCDDLRERQVKRLMDDSGVPLLCLGTTRDGHPKHPLYLRASTLPVTYP